MEAARVFSTCDLSDAIGGVGTMNSLIKPFYLGARVVGAAYTVELKSGDFRPVFAAVAMATKGHVIVVSAKGNTSVAVFGDMLARTAQKAGACGVVIDGAARDKEEIERLGLPVFAITATACVGERQGSGVLNGPISCGGVEVEPGDLVVGDENGVQVVPRARIDEVLALARINASDEEKRDQEIAEGKLLPSWVEKQIADEARSAEAHKA
jgi:4-hydroxy-4-methyl-2-oxoglutarate aldolase